MTDNGINPDLRALLGGHGGRIEPAIRSWLDDPAMPAALGEAMRYAALDGGKRLRPVLVFMSAEAASAPSAWPADPTPAAVAVELVHCYSLVHDDLPAMDNDTLRRGRPTVHVRFGEAMAILAGDALLTRAFEVLSVGVEDKALAAGLVAELAWAAGPAGMIAGQVADMELCDVPEGDAGRRYIHLRKTAALIRAAVRMGGMCAGAEQAQLDSLGLYGQSLGLAFQVTDDLLDETASTQVLGKTAGKDARLGKRSYARELGVECTRELIDDLVGQACQALACLGDRAQQLRRLALLLARRER